MAGDDGANGEVNGLELLQPLQSTFTFTRRARPPPMHISAGTEGESRVPLKQPKIQRKESKGGLRGMFTRNKTEKSTISPVVEEFTSVFETAAKDVTESNLLSPLPRSMSIKRSLTTSDSTQRPAHLQCPRLIHRE